MLTHALYAQKNTLTAGGVSTGSGGTASFSIGQIDYVSVNSGGGKLSEGVQQVFQVEFNLKYFIEGYYAGAGLMSKVLFNEGIESNSLSTNVDTVTVELHAPASPFAIVDSYKGLLQTNGIVRCSFPNGIEGNSYYVVVKHRNTLQTWSSTAITLASTLYDFTTSSNKAYGNNQTEVAPNVWAIYSGDLNADENIDLLDLAPVENDINDFQSGYVATDINGDGNVDLLDTPIMESNISNFIFAIHP